MAILCLILRPSSKTFAHLRIYMRTGIVFARLAFHGTMRLGGRAHLGLPAIAFDLPFATVRRAYMVSPLAVQRVPATICKFRGRCFCPQLAGRAPGVKRLGFVDASKVVEDNDAAFSRLTPGHRHNHETASL